MTGLGTNCVNCGAPLHGGKCEYCGTEYPMLRKAAFPEPRMRTEIPEDSFDFSVGRTMDGRLIRHRWKK